MSKVSELTSLPLMECSACGRLEYCSRDLIPVALKRVCSCQSGTLNFLRDVSPRIEFEAIGQHFYRDTGFVRPGKDCRRHDLAERQAAFDKWNKGGAMKFTEEEIIAQRAANILHDAEVKIDHLNELAESVTELAQDGKRFAFLKQCSNGGHFNEERQELVWTFHIPATRMHGNVTAALDYARFADEKT